MDNNKLKKQKLKRKQNAAKTLVDITMVFGLSLLVMYGVWQLVSSL